MTVQREIMYILAKAFNVTYIYVCFNGMKPDDEFKKHEIFLLSPRSH